MTEPTFSIVLPTYNRCDVVETTLRHLLAMDYPGDAFEIIVADNSTDGTPAMVERVARDARARVVLLADGERLPAVKRNNGLRLAGGEYVVFLNDDLWVRPDFLLEHARSHLAARAPVAVLGHVEQSLQMPQTPFIRWYRPFAYHEIADRADRPVDYRYFWSMNLSLPRAEMIGRGLLFHEDWAEIGSEDVELGYRWTRAGRSVVYNPRAWGEHFHPHTLDSASKLQASIGRGMRDLEVLIDDPGLLERDGIFSLRNTPRAVARGLARGALFNRWTVPIVQRWLSARQETSRVAEWLYWKVLLHHTNAAYRSTPRRFPTPLPILAPTALPAGP